MMHDPNNFFIKKGSHAPIVGRALKTATEGILYERGPIYDESDPQPFTPIPEPGSNLQDLTGMTYPMYSPFTGRNHVTTAVLQRTDEFIVISE